MSLKGRDRYALERITANQSLLLLAKFHLSISPIWKSPFPWLCEQIVSPGRELFLQDKALEAEPAEQGMSMLLF